MYEEGDFFYFNSITQVDFKVLLSLINIDECSSSDVQCDNANEAEGVV